MTRQSRSIVSGIHAVAAVINARPQSVVRVVFVDGAKNKRLNELRSTARAAGLPMEYANREELDRYANGQRHQGVVAQLRDDRVDTKTGIAEILAQQKTPFFVVLDGVQDPHNLGACLRTADAAGVDAVIIPKHGGVGLTDVVRRTAAGAVEHIPLVAVSNLARCLEELKQAGVWLWGTTDAASETLWDADLTGPVAIVFGAEGRGLRDLTARACDHLMRIPMAGAVPSLNVSVSAGVVLYEAVRQRTAGQPGKKLR